MSLFAGQTTTYKYSVLLVASAVVCVIVGFACAGLVSMGMGHWIELFNGATWPTAFTLTDSIKKADFQSPYTFWFYLVLAVRTLINLGVVLSAILALCWLVAGGLERMVMKQLETLEKMRTAALVGEMLAVLEDANIVPPPEVEKRMYEAARKFDSTHLGTVIKRSVEAEAAN